MGLGDGDEDEGSLSERDADRRHEHLQWEEFLSGWGAGLFNVTLTFPIHQLMFRQMLYNISTGKAFDQIRREGISHLYRGVLPPLCQKTISSSIMFGSYHYYSYTLIREFPNVPVQLSKSTGAAMAGCTEAFLTPLERLQTILQDKKYKNLQNTGHAIRHILRHHGWKEFYRGGSAIVVRNSITNILFFGSRERIRLLMPKNPKYITTNYFYDFLSGGVLGGTLSSIFYPLNVVKTRMQSTLGGEFSSIRSVFIIVFNERGRKIGNVYRGVHLNIIRSLISWGIINASYELIKSLIKRYQKRIDSS